MATANHREDNAAALAVDAILSLRPTRGKLPLAVRKLLPSPMWEGGWRRLTNQDVGQMTPAERSWEAFRLRTVAALVDDPAALPTWILNRLEALAA